MRKVKAVATALVTALAITILPTTNANATTFEVSTSAKEGKFEASSGTVSFTTSSSNTKIECTGSEISGTLTEGVFVGNEIGLILMASWNKGAPTCTAPASLKFGTSVETLARPWVLLAHELLNGKDLIDGLLHISLISFTGTPTCDFLVGPGLVPVIYHNASQSLLFGLSVNLLAAASGWGNNELTTTNARGCSGFVSNGETATSEGTYQYAAGSDVLIR